MQYTNPSVEVKMKLLGKRNQDMSNYNLPTVSEVATIVVGDLDPMMGERDILIETQTGLLKRITELNPAYFPLQYPLLFPYGEDGYREDIFVVVDPSSGTGARSTISVREYVAFLIHDRLSEISLFFIREEAILAILG
ncbi:uncharacterized protein LOC116020311 [Ipomoea triloba]|uniref:uncharacterized protein LOC116020311 n=1 Tax=Ipomoea triloba TaxID=35885 RepID=UPI00125D46AA|nr:uncharacterized protein LOC116020311 [Ipomoea triloba]